MCVCGMEVGSRAVPVPPAPGGPCTPVVPWCGCLPVCSVIVIEKHWGDATPRAVCEFFWDEVRTHPRKEVRVGGARVECRRSRVRRASFGGVVVG